MTFAEGNDWGEGTGFHRLNVQLHWWFNNAECYRFQKKNGDHEVNPRQKKCFQFDPWFQRLEFYSLDAVRLDSRIRHRLI